MANKFEVDLELLFGELNLVIKRKKVNCKKMLLEKKNETT